MIPVALFDRWHYAQNKKKLGPVSLAQLGSLLAAGVLQPEVMVLQEGTSKWRPLAEVTGATAGTVCPGGLWKPALAGSVGLVLLALLGCALVAMLRGPSGKKDVENPGPVAEISREPDQTKGTNQEATKEPALPDTNEPQGSRPQERDDPNPERDAPKQAADAAHSVGKDGLTIEGGNAKVLPDSKRLTLVYQLGHTGMVWAVAFSPDGKQVLTGSADNTARLWDVASGSELGVFKARQRFNSSMSVAFSPDGKQVLADDGGEWRLWDAASGKILEPHGKPPLAFSPDGKLLFTGGWPTPRLWDTASGKEIWKLNLKDFSGDCLAVAFSPDGKQMLMGGAGMALLWDTANAKEIRRFDVDKGSIDSVAFSPDGKQVLAASTQGPQTARLWDVASGMEIHAFQGGQGRGKFLFSPDGKRLLTGTRLRDAASGKEIRVLQGTPVAFSPDSKQVLTDFGSSARLWDADTGMAIRSFEGGHGALSPDGQQVLTASSSTDRAKKATRHLAKLWDTATGKEILAFRGQAIVITSVTFSADGKQVVMGSDDMTARLWDLPSGKKTQTFQGHTGTVHAVAFSPDGKQVLTGGDSTARLWDVAGAKEIRAIKNSGSAVAFSPGGKEMLVGSRVWDAASGKELRRFTHAKKDPYNLDFVHAVAVSPDGKLVLTGSNHSGANLWNAVDGKWICVFADDQPTPKDPLVGRFACSVPHVAFSPDGRQVVTGTEQGYVRLWNTANTEKLVAICDYSSGKTGQSPKLTCLAFAPNGSVFIGCNDGIIRLWREQGQGLAPRELRGHTGAVTSVAVSPDGKHAITASKDTTVRLWDVASGLELCQMLGFRDGSWAVVTRDNYYMASKGALQALAFRFGDRAFSFNQFDVKFNRPDKVIERIGLGSPEMVAAYGHAYQKRLKRTGFTTDMLNDDFHVPEVAATAGIKFITQDKTLKLKIKASDSKYLLDRLNIDVNGVPLQGTSGISLRKEAAKTWEQEIEVELSAGNNKIDVSVLNEKGAESLKENISINYDTPAAKPNLYVVAVGVSDYEDARFRLTYADKDARDLADLFESKRDNFGAVKVQRILNRQATRENIQQAKDFLKASQVDDLVVLFFAGHGLLDSKLDYYFATADIDFKNPAKRGLPYEAIEDLLDGIRARKKLLLMDTCHSGELDKEEVQVVQSAKKSEDEVKIRTFRGLDFEVSSKVGLNNSYQLLQEMFADLRRGTGAIVISSAGGAEFAMESATWKNGVFTHALIRGLKGEANRDKNGRVQVSELRDFVEREVRRLTNGRQAPTARRENLVVDFTLD